MNKAIHLLAVVTCLSLAGWGRAAEATPANSPTPAASPSPRLPAKDKVVVYSGAAVIDGTGGPLRPEMAIITRGERIEAILPQAGLKLPPGAEVVDAKGQYALPGFINSHEHLATPPNRKFAEAMMRRDLYGGVTAARCMGDDLRALAELARASRLLEIPGPDRYYAALFAGPDFMKDPRMIACTQGVNGFAPWIQAIDDKTDLANAVTLAKGTGAVAIKVYANLSPALVAKIVAEAHRQGMQAWAHGMVFPTTPREVIDAKPDTVSHTGYLAYEAVEKRPQRYQERDTHPIDPAPFLNGDNKIMASLFDLMKERKIILDATNYVFETIEQMRARDPENAPPPPYCSSKLAELLTAQAYKHGVLISAGTDSSAPAEDPYPALQGEIEILVRRVGMTPMDALRSATIISAMSMGQQSEMGTLEPGKLANIVFLSANPLEDIGAVRQVVSTVKRGVQHPRKNYVPITKAEVEEHF
ncbi:MAG TPA: amidohydrolase family protein [Chthoniobacterales bacterium]|nr:amidohydrolase family protein [Chthoniobacterales bacterium]